MFNLHFMVATAPTRFTCQSNRADNCVFFAHWHRAKKGRVCFHSRSLSHRTEPRPRSWKLSSVASFDSRISPSVRKPALESALKIRVGNRTATIGVSSGKSAEGSSMCSALSGGMATNLSKRSVKQKAIVLKSLPFVSGLSFGGER
jgi:hypothetical protein